MPQPARAEQAQEFRCLDGEADVLNGEHAPLVDLVFEGDVLDLDLIGHGSPCSAWIARRGPASGLVARVTGPR